MQVIYSANEPFPQWLSHSRQEVTELLDITGHTTLSCAAGDSGTRELCSAAAAVAAAAVAGASRAQCLEASGLEYMCFACRMCVCCGCFID